MSRVRLYVDEDAAHHIVVNGLRLAGFDLLTAGQAGKRGAPDEEHLAIATAEGRAIYTLNAADFARLHARTISGGGQHAGIIIVPRQRFGPSEKMRRLKELLETTTAEEMKNQIRYL